MAIATDQSLESIWKNVLSFLEKDMTRPNFVTLFKNTTLLSLQDNVATIAAPSAMIIDLIQKRYQTQLKTLLDNELGKSTELIFVPKTIISSEPSEKHPTPLFTDTAEERPKTPFIGHLSRVRPDFTFQTMAVSSSNQLAFISATTVAQNPGKTYNPLFIYGPVGVGKTHLMQAIANEVYQKNPSVKIIYITSEEFTNDVVEAIRTNQTGQMKKKYRSASLLIIDDVQFIAGKDKVQEELFHTFNILIDNSAQIVLSSDRPPHEIKKLEARLSSRFAGGLTVDVEAPDFELKTAILLIKAKKYNVELPIDVAKAIAEHVSDARSLEGALLRIITVATSKGEEITIQRALSVLQGRQEEPAGATFHPDDVIKKVCTYYGIKPTQLKGPKRDASLVKARQITMYLLKKELGLTFVEIGNLLGGRDHTTIMYGVEKMEVSVENKAKVAEDIVGITRTLL